ncbi:MAG: hypothetical protein JW751_15400 [Polyangiaceae bacterium]|nr:hypothetical protein [Polyangiaceae bacterium]
MDRALQCRVVEVEVTPAKGKKGHCQYSNGFSIDDERIVTSAHGLVGARSIVVRFLDVDPDLSLHAEVAWNGREQPGTFDVAVLRLAEKDRARVPSEVRQAPRPELPLRDFGQDEKWHGRGGFRATPLAASNGTTRSKIDDFGGVAFVPAGDGIASLDVRTPPRDPAGWRGASGSPVLCGRALLAVVRSYAEAWDGSRLRAVSLSRICDPTGAMLPSFVEALGLSARYDRIRTLVREVTQDLTPYVGLHAMLDARLRQERPHDSCSRDATGVAEELVRLSGEAVLRVCNDMLEACVGHTAEVRQRIDCGSALALVLVVERLLPHLLCPDATDALLAVLHRGRSGLLPLRSLTKTLAEVQMAAVDDRTMRFAGDGRAEGGPVGVFLVPNPPEMAQGSAATVAAVVEALAKWILSGTTSGASPAELARRVNQMLERAYQARTEQRYWYFIAGSDWDPASRAALAAALPRLKICCPDATPNEGSVDEEDWLCGLLTTFLRLKQRRVELCRSSG